MKKDELQKYLIKFDEKYTRWIEADYLAHVMINSFNRNSKHPEDIHFRSYLATMGRIAFDNTPTLRIQLEASHSLNRYDALGIANIEQNFRCYDIYPKLFTDYLKRSIAACDARFMEAEQQEELQDLEQFIQKLPPELLLNDLLPSLREVKDKIQTYQAAENKEDHMRDINSNLTNEYFKLNKQNAILKDELAHNNELLKNVEQRLPPLKTEESRLNSVVAQLETEQTELQTQKATLQKEQTELQVQKTALEKEIGVLQEELTVAQNDKAKKLEQSKIAFILEQFDNDIQKIDRKKHGKAKITALALHATLNEHARTYVQDQDKNTFIESCRTSIENTKPELNSLGWGRKLLNLFLALWNAIMPQPLHGHFFKTQLTQRTEDVMANLERLQVTAK